MNNSNITLGIVTYKINDIIPELVDSINRQARHFNEVIVSADVIDEDSYKTAKEYGFKLIHCKEGKIYAARNLILENTETSLLSFTDSDCVLDKDFAKNAERIMNEKPEVAAITGKHPRVNPKRNIWNWIHENRFRVQSTSTGYTDGVIGANSTFRVDVLKEMGGWPRIPGIMGAEDVAISRRILKTGQSIWYDDSVIVNHHYKSSLKALIKQEIVMGNDIMVMMKNESERGFLFFYTLAIPFFVGLSTYLLFTDLLSFFLLLGGTFAYVLIITKNKRKAPAQWIARILMSPFYGYGVLKGLLN